MPENNSEETKKEEKVEETTTSKPAKAGKGKKTTKKLTALQFCAQTPEISNRLKLWLEKKYGTKDFRTAAEWEKELKAQGAY